MRNKLQGLLLCLVLLAPARILADTVYTYTGNPFTTIVGSPGVTTSNFVTISFSVTSPLAANLPLGTDATTLAGFTLLVYTDGVHSYPTYPNLFFQLTTDGSGNILDWISHIQGGTWDFVESSGGPDYPKMDRMNTGSPNNYAETSSSGTWNVSEPSSLILTATGLAGVLCGRRRKLRG